LTTVHKYFYSKIYSVKDKPPRRHIKLYQNPSKNHCLHFFKDQYFKLTVNCNFTCQNSETHESDGHKMWHLLLYQPPHLRYKIQINWSGESFLAIYSFCTLAKLWYFRLLCNTDWNIEKKPFYLAKAFSIFVCTWWM